MCLFVQFHLNVKPVFPPPFKKESTSDVIELHLQLPLEPHGEGVADPQCIWKSMCNFWPPHNLSFPSVSMGHLVPGPHIDVRICGCSSALYTMAYISAYSQSFTSMHSQAQMESSTVFIGKNRRISGPHSSNPCSRANCIVFFYDLITLLRLLHLADWFLSFYRVFFLLELKWPWLFLLTWLQFPVLLFR